MNFERYSAAGVSRSRPGVGERGPSRTVATVQDTGPTNPHTQCPDPLAADRLSWQNAGGYSRAGRLSRAACLSTPRETGSQILPLRRLPQAALRVIGTDILAWL